MIKTKECPFCGDTNTLLTGHEAFETQLFVCCFECGATGPSVLKGDFETIEEAEDVAIAAWNRRVGNRGVKSQNQKREREKLSAKLLSA